MRSKILPPKIINENEEIENLIKELIAQQKEMINILKSIQTDVEWIYKAIERE